MKEELHKHFQVIEQIIQQGKTAAYRATNTFSILVKWQVGFYLSRKLEVSQYGDRVVDQLATWLLSKHPTLKGFDRRSLYRMRTFFDVWSEADWSLLPEVWKKEQFLSNETVLRLEEEIVVTLSPQLPTVSTLKGFDRRSLYRMWTFFDVWSEADWSLLPEVWKKEQFLQKEAVPKLGDKIVVSTTPQLPDIPHLLFQISWTHHIEILSRCANDDERMFYLTPIYGGSLPN